MMPSFAPRYGTARAVTTRARAATQGLGFGFMANGSWSIPCSTVVSTTALKHEPPRRPTVIPT
jgi:hypothetical protein